MTEDLLAIVEEQERLLRFRNLSFDLVVEVCEEAVSLLRQLGASCFVLARVNGTLVYARTLEGASLNNQEWARRKANLCERYSLSSMHVVHNLESGGKTLDSCGMDSKDFGFSAGSFPILLESGVCVGSISVSGLKGEEDHQIVATALSHVLGKPVGTVAPDLNI